MTGCIKCGEQVSSFSYAPNEFRCKRCGTTFNMLELILKELIKIRELLEADKK